MLLDSSHIYYMRARAAIACTFPVVRLVFFVFISTIFTIFGDKNSKNVQKTRNNIVITVQFEEKNSRTMPIWIDLPKR